MEENTEAAAWSVAFPTNIQEQQNSLMSKYEYLKLRRTSADGDEQPSCEHSNEDFTEEPLLSTSHSMTFGKDPSDEWISLVNENFSCNQLPLSVQDMNKSQNYMSNLLHCQEKGYFPPCTVLSANSVDVSSKYEISLSDIWKSENDACKLDHIGAAKKEVRKAELSYVSTSSNSDMLDKVSLLEFNTSGAESLLSLPSPNKSTVENESVPDTLIDNTAVQNLNISDSELPERSVCSEIDVEKTRDVDSKNKQYHSSICPISIVPKIPAKEIQFQDKSEYQQEPSINYFKDCSFSSDCLPNTFSRDMSSLSTSDNFLKKLNNSKPNNPQTRRRSSSVNLSNSLHSQHKMKSTSAKFNEAKSVSMINLNENDQYRHVKSKVKRYIKEIKKNNTRPSPSRSCTSTPCKSPETENIFLLNEDIVNLDESSMPDEVQSLITELKNQSNNPKLLNTLLKALISERKARSEQEQIFAALQLDYDNLLAKQAQSRNLIDELRLQIPSTEYQARDAECATTVFSPGLSRSSTPTEKRANRRFSVSLASGLLNRNVLSISQPNLIKSTTYPVTDSSLGLSLDGSGSLNLWSSPVTNNVRISLTAGTKDISKQHKDSYKDYLDRHGTEPISAVASDKTDKETSSSNRDNCESINVDKDRETQGFAAALSDIKPLVNCESSSVTQLQVLKNKLKDFYILLSHDALAPQEIKTVWMDIHSLVSLWQCRYAFL